jgi:hypothetical protein
VRSGRPVDRAIRALKCQCTGANRGRARCPAFFDKADSIARTACVRAVGAGSSRSCADRRANFPRPADARARSHLILVGADRASIAAAPKNCRRPGEISQQTRRQEKPSPEQRRHSARVLKREDVVLKWRIRRCGRVASALCLVAGAAECTTPHSGSV